MGVLIFHSWVISPLVGKYATKSVVHGMTLWLLSMLQSITAL